MVTCPHCGQKAMSPLQFFFSDQPIPFVAKIVVKTSQSPGFQLASPCRLC